MAQFQQEETVVGEEEKQVGLWQQLWSGGGWVEGSYTLIQAPTEKSKGVKKKVTTTFWRQRVKDKKKKMDYKT